MSADILSISQFDDEAMLTTGEVAQILRMHRSKAYELCATGKMRSVRNGSRYLVKAGEVRKYIDDNTIPKYSPLTDIKSARRR